MLTSLGFDTIIVNNHNYDDISLSYLFDLLYSYDVKNFVFLSDFNFETHSKSIEDDKLASFKTRLSTISPRGVHYKAYYNLFLSKGTAFNKNIKRVYACKKFSSVFVELPLFTDRNYEEIAQDLNQLLYRQKAFPIFTCFDGVFNTASKEFSFKLIKNANMGFGIDINYLFDPKNFELACALLKNRSLLVPMISHDISNYAGILKEAEFFLENIGKKNYYQLCGQMRKCAAKFDC